MGVKQNYFIKMKIVNLKFPLVSRMVLLLTVFFVALGCEDDSNPTPVLSAPAVNNASVITASGFTVSWTAVTGADKYLLDVSTVSTFATTVSGYDKKEVTSTTANVTGLATKTKYYFRLYAKKGSTTSAASATKDATTI